MLPDLRYALRRLVRAPGFTLAVVLTLGLGIGANSAVFSVVNAVLLRPPPQVREPERLVTIWTSDFSGPTYGSSSYPDVEDFRRQTAVFDGVAAYTFRGVAVGENESMDGVGLEVVSDNLFQVLGVRPQLGRAFVAEEARARAAVAVISDVLWRRRFNADPAVIGRVIRLNGAPYTVVGVAPPEFAGAMRGLAADVWVPATAPSLGLGDLTERGDRGLFVVARLRPGVSQEMAQAHMAVVARQLFAEYRGMWIDRFGQGRRITLVSEFESRVPPMMRGPVLGFIALLAVVVGIVLLICCANVAGLLLARAAGRTREIGIRLSIGASRARILRQLLTESVVLAALGAAAGILVAAWVAGALPNLIARATPVPVRLSLDLDPDARVVAFTAVAALVTGVLFGLAPALRASRLDVASVLKSDTPALQWGRRRFSLRNALVVGQLSMSMLLLVGALLFARTLRDAAEMDPGFRVAGVMVVPVSPKPGLEVPDEEITRIMRELQERVAAIPGVRAASWAAMTPFGFDVSRRGMRMRGYTPQRGEDMEHRFNIVGPGYLELMGIGLVTGRTFTPEDRAGAPGVVIVNESFARRFWPGQNPLGQAISVRGASGPWLEVVGVARDTRFVSLTESSRPYVYFPALQEPGWGTKLHVAADGDVRRLLPTIRREVQGAAPQWEVQDVRTLEEQLGGALLPQRIAGMAMGLSGALALLLAAVGLYGVVAYAVAQRTREIGVRVALGARPADVLRMMLGQGLVLTGVGVAVGVAAAYGVTRVLAGFLLGTSATDPIAFAVAALILSVISLLATYIPARRATRVDPMVALRAE